MNFEQWNLPFATLEKFFCVTSHQKMFLLLFMITWKSDVILMLIRSVENIKSWKKYLITGENGGMKSL